MADKSLEVKITADVTSLQAQSAVAKTELASLNTTVKSLATQFVAASDEMKASLAPELDKAAVSASAAKAKVAELNSELKALQVPKDEGGGLFAGLSAGADAAAKKIDEMTEKFSAFQKLTASVSEFVLAGLAVEKVADAINDVAETGEHLGELSEETGLTTEQLSALRVMAVSTGTDFDQFSTLLLRLPNTLQEAVNSPTSKAGDAFRAMGIQVTDSSGRIRPMSEILDEVSAKLSSYADGANKTALETDIFGSKIGANLIPMLNQLGQVGLAGAIEKSTELGQTWNDLSTEQATQLEDSLHTIALGFEGIGDSIVKFALPALNDFATGLAAITNSGGIDMQIAKVNSAIALAQNERGRFSGAGDLAGLNAELQQLEAQKAQITASEAQQSATAGGAAQGSAQAPNLKSGGSLGDHQGAAGQDNSDAGDNSDSSGVTGGDGGVSAARAAQDQITQIAQDAATARKAVAADQYQAQVANWEAEVSAGKMTKAQEVQDEIDAKNQMYAAALQEAQKEAALYAAGTAAKAKALDDIEVLTADHDAEMAKLNADLVSDQVQQAKEVQQAQEQAAAASQAAWQRAFQPISQAFDSSLNGVLQGTQTLQSAEVKAAQSIALAYIDAAAKKVLSFAVAEAQLLAGAVANEVGMTTAVASGETARLAVKAAATTEGKSLQLATDAATINNNAYTAATGAYAAVAGIPYVGPVLAPVAAAAAYAGVMAFDVLSAAGGLAVPAGVNPLVQLHENETVLPAHIAQPLQSFMAGVGNVSNSSVGDTNLNFYQTNHGVSGNAAGAMDSAGKAWMSQIIDLTRNGTLRLPGR